MFKGEPNMLSRRNFLKLSAASAAYWALFRNAVATDLFAGEADAGLREYLLLADSEVDVVANSGISHPGTIKILDVQAGETASIDLPLFGHIVNQNPKHLTQAVTFEKWGSQGALIDIKDQKILSLIDAKTNAIFFGHSTFSPDGNILVCTEQDKDGTKGTLVLREMSNFKIVGELPSYGRSPHECRSFDGGKTIVVANTGAGQETANVSWVDYQSGKLLRKVAFPANRALFSHLDISYDGWMCVSAGSISDDEHSRPHKLIVFISPEGKVFWPHIPKELKKRIKGEALSIAFLGRSGFAAVTVPLTNLLLIMDYKKQSVVGVIQMDMPKGVLPVSNQSGHDRELLVSLGRSRQLLDVNFSNEKGGTIKPYVKDFGGSGSHMTRIFA